MFLKFKFVLVHINTIEGCWNIVMGRLWIVWAYIWIFMMLYKNLEDEELSKFGFINYQIIYNIRLIRGKTIILPFINIYL